jgi:hypothetical protein
VNDIAAALRRLFETFLIGVVTAVTVVVGIVQTMRSETCQGAGYD